MRISPEPGVNGDGNGAGLSATGSYSGAGYGRDGRQLPDASPTNVPVPVHPLINQGMILVYPRGYECTKCE